MDPKTLFSGITLALGAFASFAISDAFSKLLGGQLDPFEVAFSGGVFGLLLLPFIRKPEESYSDVFRTQEPGMWVLRAFCTFTATAASVEAFMLLPMPEALSLMFLMPLFVTILSVVLLKEKVTSWAWLAVVLGFIGVLIVLRPGVRALHFGHLCALIAAVANAVSVIAYRLAGQDSARLSLFGSSLVGPLVGNGLLMWAHATWPHGVTMWVYLFGYGFLAAFGQFLMMMATARAPANRVALPQYSQMVWGVALSYLVFHQPLDGWTFVGILVVTLSGLLNWIRQRIRYERMALRERLERMHARKAAKAAEKIAAKQAKEQAMRDRQQAIADKISPTR
ncbi:DMT family transporter [Acetobacter orleanensis]|uniref:Transporter n=1 Tax=Acetobacter orleanensis TaxID=104099 RepID=A0A4Y3TKC7_9PROT|nr:DMT family transporter [Acetobacter orleanensis]GAN69246.1 drug/metabolite transporter integral membrane protein [Acetobacter orleanensis JCM 7639]GBR28162.1 drug/metabolite transporter integral membrane protein [Acetobacter orleanensis NRIC 0473]GEB82228.1 transporter [Acetobacter orleanensis]